MLEFSIVIPNYNQSHFLPWALESLKHQTVPFQLALMDGGSTDDFWSVVARYRGMISKLQSGPDGGQAAAIKKGKASVPGDIVAWLNADDYYFPGTLDRVAAFFEQNPKVDVVYGNAIHVDENGNFLCYFPPIQHFRRKDLARSCFICQPACFVRREVYEQIGGVDPSLIYTMDWDLWHRLSLGGAKFQYIPEVLAAVRYYTGTKTMSGNRQRYGEIWRIERKYGRHFLPFCWAGFYRYDLSFKENRNVIENLFLLWLDGCRMFRKRLKHKRKSKTHAEGLLYGFHRWETVVERDCTIHLPWYGEGEWRRLHLKVDPWDENYGIGLNDKPCQYGISETGYLEIRVPQMIGPYRRIDISRPKAGNWRLLDFRYELH